MLVTLKLAADNFWEILRGDQKEEKLRDDDTLHLWEESGGGNWEKYLQESYYEENPGTNPIPEVPCALENHKGKRSSRKSPNQRKRAREKYTHDPNMDETQSKTKHLT